MKFFSQERLWPPWLMQPTDSLLKRIPDDEDSYVDYGNEMWEVMVNLMNLSSAMESVWHQEQFNAALHAQYGDKINKSFVGSYNLRGNVVERLLGQLVAKRRAEPRAEIEVIHQAVLRLYARYFCAAQLPWVLMVSFT